MVPTLSQIEAYSTDHLVDAADHWDRLGGPVGGRALAGPQPSSCAGLARCSRRCASSSGPVSDYTVASGQADQLRSTSRIARQQAGELDHLRNSVLYAVEDAHNAGFIVGEDFSVTDTRTSRTAAELAARQAQAQVFAADIRGRAGALVGADTTVAADLSSAAAGIGDNSFQI